MNASLHAAGIPALVKSWQEQSSTYATERSVSDIAFDSVAGMVFAVIAATMAATMSMNVLERRREVGTLRALGMQQRRVRAVRHRGLVDGAGGGGRQPGGQRPDRVDHQPGGPVVLGQPWHRHGAHAGRTRFLPDGHGGADRSGRGHAGRAGA
ncbi:hypothetical protein LP420_20310 [Massilia sp. B-10]|nr:hypothetical protein LP420_20310 [Massilia sp. B-10]